MQDDTTDKGKPSPDVLETDTASTGCLSHDTVSPSAQEYILRSTLAAIKAIQATHIAGLEALKPIQASVSKIVAHQALVPEDGDGRFEDADAQEYEEETWRMSTRVGEVILATQTPVDKIANENPPQQSNCGTVEDNAKPAQTKANTAEAHTPKDIFLNHNERQHNHIQDQNVFQQVQSDIADTFAEAHQEEQTNTGHQQACSSPFIQVPRLSPALRIADEPLDELDLELLQLGEKCDDSLIPHSPGSSTSRESLPGLHSTKRASQYISNHKIQSEEQGYERSPPKGHKQLRQVSEESKSEEFPFQGTQESETSNHNDHTSSYENDDQDSPYEIGTRKRKKKKNISKKSDTKRKARLVGLRELALCSSPIRRPFLENDDPNPIEWNNNPRNAPSAHKHTDDRTKASRYRITKLKSRQKKRGNQSDSKKGATSFPHPALEFRRLLPTTRNPDDTGKQVSPHAPDYSDGFTQKEAKPIGRVMPVSRSRPRLSAIPRPIIVARIGELTLSQSRPVLVDKERRSPRTCRKAETRTFRQLQRIDARKPDANTRRRSSVKDSPVQQDDQAHEQISEQVHSHEQDGYVFEGGSVESDAIQPQQEEVFAGDPVASTQFDSEWAVEHGQMGLQYRSTPEESSEEVHNNQSNDNRPSMLVEQEPHSSKSASSESKGSPPSRKLRRPVTFNESAKAVLPLVTVPALERLHGEPNSESDSGNSDDNCSRSEEELEDQAMADEEAEEIEEEQEISSNLDRPAESASEESSDSSNERDADINADQEDAVSTQDTEIKPGRDGGAEDGANGSEQEESEMLDDDRLEEVESMDYSEGTSEDSSGQDETGDEDDNEMLLESPTIRSTQVLAILDYFLLEQEMMPRGADAMEIGESESDHLTGDGR